MTTPARLKEIAAETFNALSFFTGVLEGKRMPNMNNILNLEEQIDLRSHLQTLPVK